MAATGPDEPEVRRDDPVPKGYRFVPKGNVYITKHCRKKTHEADKALYVVLDEKNKRVGLRCPTYIYHKVMEQHRATAAQRAEAVQKRDAAIEGTFEEAIMKLFPKIPSVEIPQVLKHSLKKHSRRVGRTSTVALQDRVRLAVRAHIRHVHTDYDQLLKQGVSRLDAREQVWHRLNEVARQWGGRPLKPVVPAKARAKKNKEGASLVSRRGKSNAAVKKAAVRTAALYSVLAGRTVLSQSTLSKTHEEESSGPAGLERTGPRVLCLRIRSDVRSLEDMERLTIDHEGRD